MAWICEERGNRGVYRVSTLDDSSEYFCYDSLPTCSRTSRSFCHRIDQEDQLTTIWEWARPQAPCFLHRASCLQNTGLIWHFNNKYLAGFCFRHPDPTAGRFGRARSVPEGDDVWV
eukprot:745758-Hanusia_phi.AAC.2